VLFLVFLAVPVVEVMLFVTVGDRIGILATGAMVVLTALLGAALVRRQGTNTFRRARDRLAVGEMPGVEAAHGAMILVSGALLLTPGFLTDAIGFLLLVPAVREWVRKSILRRYSDRIITL